MYNYRNHYQNYSKQPQPTGEKNTTLKDFQIIKKLGEGSFGVVYQVRRLADGLIYALKKVRLTNMPQKDKENALNEIRILASVESDFVISYKEAFLDEDSNTLCLVLELCETGDLLKILQDKQKRGQQETEENLWLAITQLALGLKALHSNNILHRDLKCANVFVTKDQVYKLGDLNVSKVSKHGLVTTQTGTPYYASPEVWQDKPYGAKSDIWSLGCVIYEMATFKPPFRAQDMKGLYRKVVAGKYDPISSKFSGALQSIIAQLLQVDPNKRPSAEQILENKIVSQFVNKHQMYQDNSTPQKQDLLQTIIVPRNLKALLLPKSKYEDKDKEQKEKEKEQKEKEQREQRERDQALLLKQQKEIQLAQDQQKARQGGHQRVQSGQSSRQRVQSADHRTNNLLEQYQKLIEYQNSKQKLANPSPRMSQHNSQATPSTPSKPPMNKPANYHNYHSNQSNQPSQVSSKKPNLPMPNMRNNPMPPSNLQPNSRYNNNRQNYVQQLQQQNSRPSSMRGSNQQRYGSVDRPRNMYDQVLQSPRRNSRDYIMQSPRGSNQRLAAGQQVINNQLQKPSWYG